MTHPRIPAHPTRPHRLPAAPARAAALAALLAAGAISCSAAGAQPAPTAASVSPSGRPVASGAPVSGRPLGAPGSVVVLDEHAAGRTVKVGVGTAVELDLHSTYWSVPRSSAPQVLQQSGQGSVAKGADCPPGTGCGTVQARFTARHAGTATLTSTRASCGEAMACPPGGRAFTVTVDVVMAG